VSQATTTDNRAPMRDSDQRAADAGVSLMAHAASAVPSVTVSLVSAVSAAQHAKWSPDSARKAPTRFFRDLETDGKARRAAGRTPKQAADRLQKLLGDLARKATPQAASAVAAQSLVLGEACAWAQASAEIAGGLPMGDSLRPAADGDVRGVTGQAVIDRLFGCESQSSVSARLGW